MIVAIDGPAGAGKSTVARAVAQRLGAAFLDTGAMYRAVTLAVLEAGLDPGDGVACGRVARNRNLSFDAAGRLLLDGVSREAELRGPRVTGTVSRVAAHGQVREAVVARQRELAEELERVVAEGRDTTTVVFPAAQYKFFLTASAGERARRRARELGDMDRVEDIERAIRERDHLDSTRAHSPLRRAPDAVLVDTDGLEVEEVVRRILEQVEGGCGGKEGP